MADEEKKPLSGDEYIKEVFNTHKEAEDTLFAIMQKHEELFKKKIKTLFGIYEPEYVDDEEKKVEESKRTFEMKTILQTIKHKLFNKYTIEPYKADISIYEDMKEWLTLDIYIGFVSFFLNLNKELLNYTLNSLVDLDLSQEQRKILQENGPGFRGLMDLLETISLN